jgi:hypothetical protein
MANAHEPRRKHVQQQPPHELERRQRHDPLSVPMGIVLITEADLTVLEVEQAGVADGHAMRIQGQIPQHRFGTAEWWLGIHDPVLADNCGEHLLELVRREAEVVLGKRPTESGQELPRNTRLRTRTGRKKLLAEAIQRAAGGSIGIGRVLMWSKGNVVSTVLNDGLDLKCPQRTRLPFAVHFERRLSRQPMHARESLIMKQFVMAVAMFGLIAVGTPHVQAGQISNMPSVGGSTASLPPGADPLFDFSFSGGGINGSGTLDATANGDGTFTAFSGTATVTEAPNGESTLTLYANPSSPGEVLSPSGYFIYDSQLLPGQNPLITNGGLLFTSSGYEVNIFSNGPGSYTYYDNSGYNIPVSFSLSEAISSQSVPEPSTLILSGIASLMGLGFAWSRSCKAVAV